MIKPNSQLTQWILVILLAIAIGYQVSPALASDTSRINRLESQVRQLQAQLRQLNRQVSQSSRPFPTSQPSFDPIPGPSPGPETPHPLPQASQFDRLATLLVEQKQRLDSLEERLHHLESSQASPNSSL